MALTWSVAAQAAEAAAVARIHGGIIDCVGCDLKGADLASALISVPKAKGIKKSIFEERDARAKAH